MLVFPGGVTTAGGGGGPAMRSGPGDVTKEVVVRVKEVASWFEDFDIDQVVVSISGCVSTGSALKLIVDAQGQGGVTVTLKPKHRPAGEQPPVDATAPTT